MWKFYVTELRILNKAETPPFEIVEHSNVKEDLRLKYRYLDLRRRIAENYPTCATDRQDHPRLF